MNFFFQKKKHSTTDINERKKKVFLFHSEFDLCFFFVKDGFVFSALKRNI